MATSKFITSYDPSIGKNVVTPMTEKQYISTNNPSGTGTTTSTSYNTSMNPSATDPLDPYRVAADNASKRASEISASASGLPEMLRSALQAKLGDSPIVTERGTAATNFLTELGNAPTTVMPDNTGGVILSPAAQAKLISARRASALTPLINANQRYDLNTGSISDIINSSASAAQILAQLAQGDASRAQNTYQDMATRLTNKDQMDWEKQKFAAQMGLEYAKLNKTNSTTAKKEQDKKMAALESLNTALDRVKSAREANVAGASGLLPGAGLTLRNLLGGNWGLSDSTTNLDSALANLNQSIFDTSGKALSKTESEILAGRIPKAKYDQNTINTQIDAIDADLRRKFQEILSSGDWEVVQ